jgi:hypothetical protein
MNHSQIANFAARLACGAAAVLAVAACAEPKINQRFECTIEDIILGEACIPPEYADELPHEACKYMCEQSQAVSPPENPIHDYDCDDVSYEEYTDQFPTECEPEVDWEEVILDDPDSGLTHSYSCNSQWQAFDYFCPWDVDDDGEVELGEGSYLEPTWFQGCGIDSTAGHQSCIDNCAEAIEATNDANAWAGIPCNWPVAICNGIDFAIEQQGQVCDSVGMVIDRAGDRADKIVWSTADGGPATRPLACSLSGNCCDAFGPAVCSNLKLGTRSMAAADHITGISGTVTFASDTPGAAPVVVQVGGTVRSSSRSCINSAGTCPLYLEDLQLVFPQYIPGIVLDGTQYNLFNLSATLEAPTLGVADMSTRAVKLLGDRASLRLSATAQIPAKGVTVRVDEIPALPAAIDARINQRGEIIALTSSVSLPGSHATITIQLGGATASHRGAQ